MYLALAFSDCWRDCRTTGRINPDSTGFKTVFTTELSQQVPRPLGGIIVNALQVQGGFQILATRYPATQVPAQ